MQRIRETLEILRPSILEIDPRAVRSYKPVFDAYLNGGLRPENVSDRHASGWFALKSKGFKRCSLQPEVKEELDENLIVTSDPEYDMTQHWWDEEGPLISPDDEFINVIRITSAVTRNGGWCSQGSLEHRDQMIFASKFPNCIGHLFIVDTPGGSAFSRNDYQQGIDAARAAGQPVITWIDGICCSAGVAATCQTDEIYVMHENDEVGCIGTMAAFYTLADGTADKEGYVYHELYDPESFEKNLEYRELANNNNADPILKDLAEDGAEFRALVKKNRPGVTEDMLHGKVFKAYELMGTLVDGVKTMEEVIDRIVELRGGAPLISHVAVSEPAKPDNPESPDDPDNPETPENPETPDEQRTTPQPSNQTTKINKDMIQYEQINAALELENIPVTADGSISNLDPVSCQTLNDKLAQAEKDKESLKAHIESVSTLNSKVKELNEAQTSLNGQVATLTSEKQTLESEVANLKSQITNLEAEKTALANEKTELANQMADKEKELNAQADKEKEELNGVIAEKDKKIEELEKAVADKDAELSELAKQTPAAPTPVPAAAQEEKTHSLHIYKEGMTSEERRKALEAEMNRLRNA